MVGTLPPSLIELRRDKSLFPPCDFLRTDLLRAQAQSPSATAANRHDGQITSDFQKSCQAGNQKYSAFVLTQIIGITPPVSPD
jgi:hypothetical protein